jgi:hypothetical protein
MRIPLGLGLLLAFAIPAGAQQSNGLPSVPLEVLSAKTIAVAVYWPDATWQDKVSVQADGENFLRRWKRYKVIRLSEGPDLIALVAVEPVGRTGGFWKSLAYALSVGAQAYAQSSQNYEQCQGQTSGDQVNITCYGYNPVPATPPPPPPPNYVLSGSILLFDGKFLRAGGPVPEPLLFAEADSRGSAPLIGAGKRLRRMIEESEKSQAGRMATVNALLAKIHELSVANGFPLSEEPGCAEKISTRIGADKNLLARVEHGDFQDIETLFRELCEVEKPGAGALQGETHEKAELLI